MREGGLGTDGEPPDKLTRESVCFSQASPGAVLHSGQEGFVEGLGALYSVAEGNALEKLIDLKTGLRGTDTETFWSKLTEGLADITGAQYAFVSKRMIYDNEDLAVELPPIGEPGSCLMGTAFYVKDDQGDVTSLTNFKYHAYSCPCAYMRHDKIFIVPDGLNDFILNNPNTLKVPAEAYIGIPLFAGGKCFAHFGLMWSAKGLSKRTLTWSFVEAICHSLEDMILERLLRGTTFGTPKALDPSLPTRLVPHDAVSMAQSLKPYARSLSHELRTPMQGIVGMLDVMYATVQEASEGLTDPRVRSVFQTLKENIEVIQDSSRRAVEAADNVVHAYDMNMGVPDGFPSPPIGGSAPTSPDLDRRPDIVVTGNNMLHGGTKRRRDSITWGNPNKHHAKDGTWQIPSHGSTSSNDTITHPHNVLRPAFGLDSELDARDAPSSPTFASESHIVPGLRHTNLRDVLQYIINDALKVGGRPESAVATETNGGEFIEVRTKSGSGVDHIKVIEWTVDSAVPESILIDEKDLAKVISCVVLNAIKFTEDGKITISAKLSPKCHHVTVTVKDTGIGIPDAFMPHLFKPFAMNDVTTTRQNEGLGLGLMVAKGIARRLGGDLVCVHSRTDGPFKGSEFEIRVPLTPGDARSRASSPFTSPSPSFQHPVSTEPETSPLRNSVRPESPAPVAAAATANPREYLQRASTTTTVPSSTPLSTPQVHPHLPPAHIHRFPSSPALRPGTAASQSNGHAHSRPTRQPSTRSALLAKKTQPDLHLAQKYPLNFLVVEDNKINRHLLVSMLRKFGYESITEAYDGVDAVRKMERDRTENGGQGTIDVVLMDLWMPFMDGYEAARRILSSEYSGKKPVVLAVTADVTDGALEKAARAGMKGFMAKPYKLLDLERLIVEYCASAELQ